ncbi:D-glycero-beta-D-manno-heptose-7-phosphate kinase [Roseomonas sp. NAR14]|uniref:Bifunctional protein HldE n=1 Tax=Roseomonas acroporae TaxID=2937791 RepID=A0A9X2BYB4_9PROT|nr:D-glycero-beta-D-manno-heptose-7-phosphate kinase [Roseomonas acroporae]MCK8786794.1 D-glycero-beta-D-manno-heptose-7-phosphate kinase [Roseomonas acroporae]
MSLSQHLTALQGTPVAVVGDVMLDHYVFGAAERISPEAPVPVLRARSEADMLGGAGNVLRNLAAVGAAPTLIGVLGTDRTAERVTALLKEAGTDSGHMVRDPERPTTAKTRFLAGSHAMLRVDWEEQAPLGAPDCDQVVAHLEALLGSVRLVVLSDYGKGVLAGDTPRRLIALARGRGLPVIVDPKGTDWSRYAGATLITPNRAELCAAAGIPRDSGIEAMLAASRRLIAGLGLEAIVLTRSEEGMSVVFAGEQPAVHIPTRAREVSDVSGAGDTVVALLAASLAAGLPLTTAAELANVAAGIVVAKVGAATATQAEIRAELERDARHAQPEPVPPEMDDKVVDRAAAAALVAGWTGAGLKVGFTNGCFDLLHPGHVRILAAARRHCDRLVVGLNTDASVRRLKGETRPIQSEDARATVLSALASVDAVVLFGEDTPLELITALRPAMLFKGADYRLEEVVGGEFVRANGGQVVLLDLVPGNSTTKLVEKAKRGGAL